MFNNIENLKIISALHHTTKPYGKVELRKADSFIIRVRGSMQYFFEDRTLILNEGEMIFLPKGCSYEYKKVSEGDAVATIINMEGDFGDMGVSCYSIKDFYDAEYIMYHFADLWKFGAESQKYQCMSLLYGLMQKHGCANVSELISLRDNLSEALFDSTQLEERREELNKKIASKASELNHVADLLHQSRSSAAGSFASTIQESIRGLELPYAIFEVELLDVPVSARGRDSVQFRFSSSGRNAVDVAKCASGGEMSRIMLALKAMRARFANMPTMIFDEIDTGVSGSVADKMGSMICAMGEYMQVFAITHLPQVAAKGKAHYRVSKEIDPATSKAVSTIEKLSEDQRVLEVARMLSGSVLTDAAIANAKSLLRG